MGSRKIVIIEDEQDLAIALSENLTSKGFAVKIAKNGEEGVDIIKQYHPDLILLDSILPGMSGVDVLESLKTMREEKNIPIIMLSNLDDPEDVKEARKYGIEEYLVKTDWKLADVVAKIAKAIK